MTDLIVNSFNRLPWSLDCYDKQYPDCRSITINAIDARLGMNESYVEIYKKLKLLSQHPAVRAVIEFRGVFGSEFVFYYVPKLAPDDTDMKFLLCGEIEISQAAL